MTYVLPALPITNICVQLPNTAKIIHVLKTLLVTVVGVGVPVQLIVLMLRLEALADHIQEVKQSHILLAVQVVLIQQLLDIARLQQQQLATPIFA
jgi:ribosomal protein S15P/S13E